MSGEKPLNFPEQLQGEDRNFGGGLSVDLIPEPAWEQSVKRRLSQYWWRRLSRGVRQRADWRCEICGDPEDATQNRYLSCHERWDWQEDLGVQRLARLMALCVSCDAVTHLGYYLIYHDDDTVPQASGEDTRMDAEAGDIAHRAGVGPVALSVGIYVGNGHNHLG